MSKKTITGIDIGTFHVKVVITELRDGAPPHILGTGFAESKGLRHGYIVNTQDIVQSIHKAVRQAQEEAQAVVKKAYLSVGGVGIEELHSHGSTIISRADAQVTPLDIENAMHQAEKRVRDVLLNRKIIHEIPTAYSLDGADVLGRVLGMHGSKLEIQTLFITALEQHLNDLITAVEQTGIEVIDVMASPIAASLVTLTKAQKTAGCVLANIGSETVSIVIFEDNTPVSLKVFPIGSSDITNDIALGLKIPLEEAEQVKRGVVTNTSYPQKKLEDIVARRLRDIFYLIEEHLKKLGKNALLPAGIIITGGGSGIATIEDFAQAALHLPSRIARTQLGSKTMRDSTWAVAYGLCIWGASNQAETPFLEYVQRILQKIGSWIKQFLP